MVLRLFHCGLALLGCGLAPVWLFSGLSAVPGPPVGDVVDPLPIQRVPLDATHLAQEMERVRNGLLVQLPRADFEERVRQAAQAKATPYQPPHLIEALYRARLEGTAFVGTGQWKIVQPGTAPAILPLEALNLCLRQPRFENRDALVGDFNGKDPGLLLDQTGPRTVALDWTARGDPAPDGLHFDLKIPACAVALLELTLPADRRVSVSPDSCLLSGPLQAEKPDERLWKIGLAGRSQLHVLIDQAAASGRPRPLVLATLKTVQEVTPDFLQADYQFDLQVPRGVVRDLVCECDPVLRPYDVTIAGLDTWQYQPGQPGALSKLLITLREPLSGTLLLRVRCHARLADGPSPNRVGAGAQRGAWRSPGMHLAQSVARGETLVLRLHPDIRFDDWKPNGFRLKDLSADATGWRVFTLTGGGILGEDRAEGGSGEHDLSAARPSARLRTGGADYRARVVSWWQVRPSRETVTAQITYEVLQGHLFQLPLLIPPGWVVERLEMSPPSLLRNWNVKADSGRTLVTVDLQRSLAASHSSSASDPFTPPPRLTLGLRPALRRFQTPNQTGIRDEWLQPFPDIVPVGARWSEGALAIDYDERAYQANIRTSLIAAPAEEEGPWGKQPPNQYYPYRDQPLSGTLLLHPRALALRGRCIQDVFPDGDHVILKARVHLQPQAGTLETLDLVAPAPLGTNWSWTSESGGSVIRVFEPRSDLDAAVPLSILAGHTPLEVLALLTAQPLGEHWRLTLTPAPRPSDPITLRFTCEVPRGEGERWDVPLLTLVGLDAAENETILHLPPSGGVQVETQGLFESAGSPDVLFPSLGRTFRHAISPARLTLFGPLPGITAPPAPTVRRAVLVTQVMPDHLLHVYRFQVDNWRKAAIPLSLPSGSSLLSVRLDGRPLEGITADDSLTVSLLLPASVPPNDSWESLLHLYEVTYTEPRSEDLLWSRVTAPIPELPIKPDALRRVWRLPPGWQPLSNGRYLALPGPAESACPLAERLKTVPDRLMSFSANPEWELRQRQSLGEAAARLRGGQAANVLPLRDALERLAVELGKDQTQLVVHTQALHEAGIGLDASLWLLAAPSDSAMRPAWEALGLICMPSRSAPVMTTRRQWETWQTSSCGNGDALDPAVVDAVAEAVTFGRDSSNRFRTVADWLRTENTRPAKTSVLSDQSAARFPPGWTEWEPVAGDSPDTQLWLVRRDAVTLGGLALAAAGIGLLGLTWSSLGSWRPRLLVLWLLAGGLAVCWLPSALNGLAWWFWLPGIAVAALWYMGSALPIPAQGSAIVTAGAARASAAAAVILFALVGLYAWAAAPEPVESFTVFLMADPAGRPEKQSVLLPRELFDRLEALAHPTAGAPRGAILLSAAYNGAAAEEAADFHAVFQVHCFEDVATLTLPLTGVKLEEEVLIDGARAYPSALAAPQAGYTLKVEGQGAHIIRLRFRVPVQIQGENREVHFGAPRLLQSRLAINLPPAAGDAQIPTRLGEQRITTATDGVRIEADLGRVTTPLAVRWREETRPPRPPYVELREAYLWDLRDDASSLKALLQYNVIRGTALGFELDLPDPLDVRHVEVQSSGRGKLVPRLKDWRISTSDGQRRLHLEFQNAVTGGVQLALDLVPRRPFAATATLPLPLPRDAHSVQSYLAYQLNGVAARLKDLAHLTGPRVDDFLDFWRTTGQEEPVNLATAFAITRKENTAPLLRLQLSLPGMGLTGTEDISWRVSRHQADVQMTARLQAPAGTLSVLECVVPSALNVSHVSGRNIWHWSQSGSRLQVWFNPPIGAADVQIVGWLPLGKTQDNAASSPPAQFDLPSLRVLGLNSDAITVRIAPAIGIKLTRRQLRNLSPLPESTSANAEHAYLAKEADYGASFQVLSANQALEVRVLTTAEVRNRQLTFIATVECRSPQGDARSVEIRLDDWEAEDLRVDTMSIARQREYRTGSAGRTWSLELEPGAANLSRFTVTMTRSLQEIDEVIPVPRLSVPAAGRIEHWLVVRGPGLAPEASFHLSPVAASASASTEWQRNWPGEAERLRRQGGAAWKVLDNSPVRLVSQSITTESAPVHVFLVEQSAALADGHSWLHQATAWLFHRAGCDWAITLPQGATLVKAAIDGRAVAPTLTESQRIWLRLADDAGACRVTLRWKFDPPDESLANPNLARPTFDGANAEEQLWTIHVPRGYRAESAAGPPNVDTLADRDMRCAEAYLRLSSLLAERSREASSPFSAALLSAQQRFYQACRFAELELAGDPADSASMIWLGRLREQNKVLARNQGFEKTRTDAERQVRAGLAASDTENTAMTPDDSLPERGTPIYGHVPAGALPPHIHLQSDSALHARKMLAASLILLCMLMAICVLSYCPRVLAWVRRFWPEQMVFLAALLWLMEGPAPAILALILLGIIGRLLEIGVLAHRFLRTPPAPTDSGAVPTSPPAPG